MIGFVKIKRHCGHHEKKLFMGSVRKFKFWYDWEHYNKCQKCCPDELKPWEVISYLSIAIGILTILYFLGIIQ